MTPSFIPSIEISLPLFVSDDDSAIREIISVLQDVSTASTTERRTRMTQLIRMMRDGKTAVIQEHFR